MAAIDWENIEDRGFVLGDGIGHVEYRNHMGDDYEVVRDARRSYDKQDEPWREDKDPKLIRYLAKYNHLTPFEGCVLKVSVKAPMFVVQQILRHRTFSYNQVSHRYVKLTNIEYYAPTSWRMQSEDNKQGSFGKVMSPYVDTEYREAMGRCIQAYNRLINSGVAREMSRMILPHSIYTGLTMTGNLRNWAHFLNLRLDPHAQEETRLYAEAIYDITKQLFPISMEHLVYYKKGTGVDDENMEVQGN